MYNQISLDKLNYNEKLSLYSRTIIDYLNIDAIYSDCTDNYVCPCQLSLHQTVTFKIRVGKNNVDKVLLVSSMELEMEKTETKDLFDYYQVEIPKISEKFSYYFQITKNNKIYYYNRRGLYLDIDKTFNFYVIPSFYTPDWAKGAVMYHIYVDRFYNGDKNNDVANNEYAYLGMPAKHISDWNQPPDIKDVCNFYGGDLNGVMEKMAYLKDLGIDAIYFCPIFVSPSNHKYDIQDYDYIDPHLGVIIEDGGEPLYFEKFNNRYATMYMQRTTKKTNLDASNELFCKLVELAHENGIKVILDGVFNHCGAFNKWMDKENFYSANDGYPIGAYREKDSVYHDYFRWYDKNWPNNDCYDSWWGFDNHPKLNYEASPELLSYIMEIGKKWVSPPFNADGWRIDVAADLGYSKEFNHQFWQQFRKVLKEANPNAIILAEHYGDPADWLQGDQWDTIMNYDAFMEPITWFLTGMEKHSEAFQADLLCNAMAFESAMRYQMNSFPIQSLQVAMNELSNHDHSRFLTRTNMQAGRLHTKGSQSAENGINKNILMEAVMFQMTWPGAPTIYYGDEVGQVGWTDPDNRRTFPWGKEDMTLLNLHKETIALRKKYDALKTGSVEFIYSEYGVISYGRWNKANKFVVILNNNTQPKNLKIPVWKVEVASNSCMTSLVFTGSEGFTTEKTVYTVTGGHISLLMPPFSSILLIEGVV